MPMTAKERTTDLLRRARDIRVWLPALFVVAAVAGYVLLPREEAAEAPGNTGPSRAYDRGPLELSLTTSADPITTADTLELRLEATVDEGYEVALPAYPEPAPDTAAGEVEAAIEGPEAFTLADYEDSAPVLLADSRIRQARTYFLDPFLAGSYEIPPLELRYGPEDADTAAWHTLQTDALMITVASVLGPDTPAGLEGIAGPVSVQDPTPWGTYLVWTLILGALLGGGYYYWFVREKPAPPPPPPIPPYKRALEALEAIQRERLIEKGLYKEYYTRVSDVLRRYMEDEFGFPASERTTEEFLQDLQHGAVLGLQEQLLLKEFLRHCDLVKFAKVEPSSEEIRSTFETCKQFVHDTNATRKRAAAAALEGG